MKRISPSRRQNMASADWIGIKNRRKESNESNFLDKIQSGDNAIKMSEGTAKRKQNYANAICNLNETRNGQSSETAILLMVKCLGTRNESQNGSIHSLEFVVSNIYIFFLLQSLE